MVDQIANLSPKGDHVARLFRAGAWSLVSLTGAKVCVAAALVLTARLLPVTSFGVLVEVQAVAVFVPSVWDLGVSGWLLRDVAAGVHEPGGALKSAARARALTFVVPLIIWTLVLALLPQARNSPGLVALFFLTSICIGSSALLGALLQAELRFGLSTAGTLAGRIVTVLALAILTLTKTHDLVATAGSYTVGEFVILAVFATTLRRRLVAPAVTTPFRAVLRKSRPYALNGIVNVAYNRADVLTVGLFGGTLAAAQYAPASRIQDALFIVPSVVGMSLMPVAAHRWQRPDAAKALKRAASLGALGSAAITIPVVLAVFFLAPSLVPFFLGHAYDGSLAPIRIIIWSAIFVAIAEPYFSILYASGAVRDLNRVYLQIGLVSILGQAVLSHTFGAVGGAIASAAREPLAVYLGVATTRSVMRRLPPNSNTLGSTPPP
jgi:O-antigen/teichoic acid export membrane protein